MVLGPQGPGRVGRRRSLRTRAASGRLVVVVGPGFASRSDRRLPRLSTVSTLAIVLIVLAALFAILFVGGYIARRRFDRSHRVEYDAHLRSADRALEAARAADRGWERSGLEAAAREALGRERPGWETAELQLVLLDDRPGVDEDRAHFVASGRDGDDVRLVLTRQGGAWALEHMA